MNLWSEEGEKSQDALIMYLWNEKDKDEDRDEEWNRDKGGDRAIKIMKL